MITDQSFSGQLTRIFSNFKKNMENIDPGMPPSRLNANREITDIDFFRSSCLFTLRPRLKKMRSPMRIFFFNFSTNKSNAIQNFDFDLSI